jgi:hypothetical protein
MRAAAIMHAIDMHFGVVFGVWCLVFGETVGGSGLD